MIALDDSQTLPESSAANLTLKTLPTIIHLLTLLEVALRLRRRQKKSSLLQSVLRSFEMASLPGNLSTVPAKCQLQPNIGYIKDRLRGTSDPPRVFIEAQKASFQKTEFLFFSYNRRTDFRLTKPIVSRNTPRNHGPSPAASLRKFTCAESRRRV